MGVGQVENGSKQDVKEDRGNSCGIPALTAEAPWNTLVLDDNLMMEQYAGNRLHVR